MVSTHNPVLVHVQGGNGMKTGFTCSAGYNIIGTATRDNNTLVAIVLGDESPAKREAHITALIERGFRTLATTANIPSATIDDLPVEQFDVEQVRGANLTKRFKDCREPELELDAEGNPVCPPAKEIKRTRSGRAVHMKTSLTEKAKPTVCAPLILAKSNPPSRPQVRAITRRGTR